MQHIPIEQSKKNNAFLLEGLQGSRSFCTLTPDKWARIGSLEKRRLTGILSLSTANWKEVAMMCGSMVSSPKKSDGMKGNGIKLHPESFRQNIRKNFFTEKLVRHSNRLPREVVESPFLEAFKRFVNMGSMI